MWLLIKMSGKWYAKEYADQVEFDDNIENMYAHVNNGEVVSVTDDLETWCDEMDVDQETVNVVKDEEN